MAPAGPPAVTEVCILITGQAPVGKTPLAFCAGPTAPTKAHLSLGGCQVVVGEGET